MRTLLSLLPTLLVGASLTAQTTATYELFGHGCNGGTLSECITQNATNPTLNSTSLPNE